MRQATAEAGESAAGEAAVSETDKAADAVTETEEEKTEEALENLSKSTAADVKAIEALNETFEAIAYAPAMNVNYEP